MIYKKTKNLRAVQILLGHTKLRARRGRRSLFAGVWGEGIPLDRRPVLAENPVTRGLSALCPGRSGGERGPGVAG
jgi:hypothetical protein